jgi:putative CocE/NonD family hydrolase
MSKKAIIRDYSKTIEVIELAWIPLQDGRRLAARLFLPKSAARKPVPAILEYIPYRRRDGTRGGDDQTHAWFAGNGYASARVDITGSGDSDGLLLDEYLKLEQDDACEVIAWLAAQPWCSGSVGMIGISWGGFNGLQVAARRPPALKAVVSLCSTVDRYADDMHFMGGALMFDSMDWGGTFFSVAGLPPDPAMVGDEWKKKWLERLEVLQPFPATWLKHQRRDAFWKHGSVCENYDAIRCPVLSVGGWADGYTAAIFRLTQNLKAPCKGIVGPWGHLYPQRGIPGPAIGFLQECRRWWDRWLKSEPNGVDKDPTLRVWVQDGVGPKSHYSDRPGRWVALDSWPSKAIKTETWRLNADGLGRRRGRAARRSIKSPQITGRTGGEWCAYGLGKVTPEMPLDQRPDDIGSLVFDGKRFEKSVAIVGEPMVELSLRSDCAQTNVAVRLCDVAPDGSVTRITYGILNLSHRESHEKPKELVPGKRYKARVALKAAAYVVPKGHRIRVSISTNYWPLIVPPAQAPTLEIDCGRSRLELPILPKRRMGSYTGFKGPEGATPMRVTALKPGSDKRELLYDVELDRTTFRASRDDGRYRIEEIGTIVTNRKVKSCAVTADDPLTLRQELTTSHGFERDDWRANLETSVVMTCNRTHFIFESWARAEAGQETIFERRYSHRIRRDHL